MEYRSPLAESYEDERSSRGYGSRYKPYERPSRNTYSTEERQHRDRDYSRKPHMSNTRSKDSRSSNVPKYSDRYKPSTLPKELTELFGPLECKLCVVKVDSPIVAKMHYSGKQHLKKIKQYMTEWCLKTGNSMPELGDSTSLLASGRDLSNYCEVCDVRLLSTNDCVIHYSGKNHKKNMQDPANAKKKFKPIVIADDPTNRFGIGSDFSPVKSEVGVDMAEEYPDLVCTLCDVKAVSIQQLKAHLIGKKHKDKLEKKNSAVPKPEEKFVCDQCNVTVSTEELWQCHITGKKHMKKTVRQTKVKHEVVCDVCDVTFPYMDQYLIHVKGKRHEKNCQLVNANIPDSSTSRTCNIYPFVNKNLTRLECDKSLLKIEFDHLEIKYVCKVCCKVLKDENQFREHKTTRKHILGILNEGGGDTIVEEFKQWFCAICKKQLKNQKEYTDHLTSDSTHNTLEELNVLTSRNDFFRCSVCDILIDKGRKDDHMKDVKHLINALTEHSVSKVVKLLVNSIDLDEYECEDCNVELPSFEAYFKHLLSKDHLDVMLKVKLGNK